MGLYLATLDPVLIKRWRDILHGYNPCVLYKEEELKSLGADTGMVILSIDDYPDYTARFQRCIVLCSEPRLREGKRLLAAGVKAYGNAYLSSENLKSAVETVRSGNIWIYPDLMHYLIGGIGETVEVEDGAVQKLSKKQLEVARLLSRGLGNREIARQMGITERTVKSHLTSIYEKTGTRDRVSLALLMKRF